MLGEEFVDDREGSVVIRVGLLDVDAEGFVVDGRSDREGHELLPDEERASAQFQLPEVVECHYTTGKYDMFLKIYARNNNHLLQIIHTKLQPLGLARTESIISFKEAFRRQLPIENISTYEKAESNYTTGNEESGEEPVKKKRGRKSNSAI